VFGVTDFFKRETPTPSQNLDTRDSDFTCLALTDHLLLRAEHTDIQTKLRQTLI